MKILRREIENSPISRNAICKAVGIDKAAISRFMAGGGLNADTAGKLLSHFGYELKKHPGRE